VRYAPEAEVVAPPGMGAMRRPKFVTFSATYPLTFGADTVTSNESFALVKDALRRHAAAWGGCGSRGRTCTPLPGGSGPIRPAGMTTGLRGNPLHWDGRARVTPAPSSFRPRKCVNWS
jgi:hypothetical protein